MLTRAPFYYLRHGETDWNRQRLAQGQTDVPLNATGRAQAAAAARLLEGLPIRTICSSPLSRARETADHAAAALGLLVVEIPDLMEARWGEREGTKMGNWFEAWERGEDPPGAESYAAFLVRALRGVNAALAHPGPVLIVAHGGVYWSIEQHASIVRDVAIPNGIPVRHDPPGPDRDFWTATVIGDAPDQAGRVDSGGRGAKT